MNKRIAFICITILFYILSCNDVKNQSVPKDSELTLLMRQMYDESEQIKAQILKGEKPQILDQAEALLHSHSTDPSVAESEAFKLFAESYLAAIDALKNADAAHIQTSYEIMVTSCMNCHRQLCPGPMMKIKKLYLE